MPKKVHTLSARRISEEQIRRIMMDNPVRAFAF